MQSTIIIYRLFDVAEEINLELAQTLWLNRNQFASRLRFSRIHTKSMTFKDPPVIVELGSHEIKLGEITYLTNATAKIYDYGVISLNIAIQLPEDITYDEYLNLAIASDSVPEAIIQEFVEAILSTINAACYKPTLSKFVEDFVVFYFEDELPDWNLAQLLMKDKTELNPESKKIVLENRFSYSNDITYITWESAIVFDPTGSRDIPDLLEFGSAQFLELRYYDNLLNEAIEVNYDEIEALETNKKANHYYAYNQIRGRIMERMGDASMLTSNIINSLQLTEDTFYAKVYTRYMQLQKTSIWRQSINQKLKVLQTSYNFLNEEVINHRKEIFGKTVLLILTCILLLQIYIAFL